MNKTVLHLEIPLHNCGPAGLGVTVYTKSSSSKGGGEMGVYIKSIVAGGAAARVRDIDYVPAMPHEWLGNACICPQSLGLASVFLKPRHACL